MPKDEVKEPVTVELSGDVIYAAGKVYEHLYGKDSFQGRDKDIETVAAKAILRWDRDIKESNRRRRVKKRN